MAPPVTAWDEQGKPIQTALPPQPTAWDASGKPIQAQPSHPDPPAFPLDDHINAAVQHLPPEHQEAARSGLSSVFHSMADPWIAAGYDTLSAYQRGTAHFYDTMELVKRAISNVEPDAMKNTAPFKPGGKGPMGDEFFKNVADSANASADYWKQRADKVGLPFFSEMLGNAVGGAISSTTEFLLDVASGLTVPAVAGAEKAHEHHTDPVIGGLVEAAKTGTMAMMFEMMGPFSQYVKATTLGATFGAEAAAEAPAGQRLKAGAMGVGTGMLLGGLDRGGNTGIRDLYPDLGKSAPAVRAKLDETAGTTQAAPEQDAAPTTSKEPAPSKEPTQKPLYDMNPDEIESARVEASGRDQSDEEAIFGKEGAAQYKKLQRKANSTTDPDGADAAASKVQDMESELSKDQQDRLYGIGDTRHQLEDINEYRDALNNVDESSPEAMADSLKWAVSQIGDPSKPVEEMNPKQQVRYAQLRHAFEVAKDNGWDTQAIIKKSVMSAADRFDDPNDAAMMLEKVARSIDTQKVSKELTSGEASVGQPNSTAAMRNPAKPKTDDGSSKNPDAEQTAAQTPDGAPAISELTEALKSIPRDTSFNDRMDIANIARQKIGGVLGATETAFAGVKAVTEAAKDWYMKPPTWTDFDDMFGKFLGARQRNGLETDRFGRQILDSMPSRKQRAITNYMQAAGDTDILQQRSDMTTDSELKQGYQDALTLTDQEKGFATDVRAHWDRDLDENIKAGILDHGVENYVNQVWKNSPDNPVAKSLLAEANSGKLSRNPAYAKKRIFDSYFEGEQAGYTPKDKRIGFLVAARQKAFDDATAARRFVTELSKGNATDGRPLVVTKGIGQEISKGDDTDPAYLVNPNATGTVYKKDADGKREVDPATDEPIEVDTHDYKTIDHPALRKQKWVASDTGGNPIFVQGDLKVHPEVYKKLDSFLGRSAVRNHALGRLLLRGNAEVKGTLLGFFSPFHQVHLSQTAATHGVNALAELLPDKINLDDPVTSKLIDHGLLLYEHDGMAAFSSGAETTGIERFIPIVGKFSSEYQSYLFGPDGFVPRLKERAAKVAYERNREHYPNLSDDQVAKLSADQTNASFGGQNYEMMGRSKTSQDLMRLAALAPNFLEARARSVAQGLMPYGREQFTAIALRGAIGMYVIARITEGIAHQIDPEKNKVHWDQPFEATIDGKNYTLRSEQGDIQHLVTDPRSFLYYRLSPGITKPAIEALTGRDNWGRKRDATQQLKDWATSAVPIAGQGFFSKQDFNLYQSMLQSLGVSSFNARTEAEKVVMDISHENNLETRPAATQKRMAIKNSLGDAFLKTGDYSPVEKALEEGKITPKDAAAIQQWSVKGDILSGVRSFSLPDTLKVWDKANDEEKGQLQESILKKWVSWNATPAERDEFSGQIDKVLAWEPKKRFSIRGLVK